MADDHALSARVRHLADRLATEELGAQQRLDLERLLAEAAAVLGPEAHDRSRFARSFDPDGVHDGPVGLPAHPLALGTSAVYPPLHFDLSPDGSRLVAEVRFGPAWEGPPGLVHGGFLAAGFDMVLSAMANHHLDHGVTRWLRVRYLKPTVLGSQLRYEVVLGEASGRLLDLAGTLFADDRVTMRATAQFASVPVHRFGVRPGPGDAAEES